MNQTPVSLEAYNEALECSMGWCKTCGDFTRECTEPDAEDYDCPECGEDSVMGASLAMVAGEIEVG